MARRSVLDDGSGVVKARRSRTELPIKVIGDAPARNKCVTVTIRGRNSDGKRSGLKLSVWTMSLDEALDAVTRAVEKSE